MLGIIRSRSGPRPIGAQLSIGQASSFGSLSFSSSANDRASVCCLMAAIIRDENLAKKATHASFTTKMEDPRQDYEQLRQMATVAIG